MCNYFFIFRMSGDKTSSYTALPSAESITKAIEQVKYLEDELIKEYKTGLSSIETHIYEITALDTVVNSCAGLGESDFIAKCCNQKPVFARLKEF